MLKAKTENSLILKALPDTLVVRMPMQRITDYIEGKPQNPLLRRPTARSPCTNSCRSR